MRRTERLIGLDIFRIAAALIVFLFHSAIHIGCNYGIAEPFVEMGAVFMTGFFMLSGFLMYYIYGKRNLTEIREIISFYKKRFACIMPVYYAVSILFVFVLGNETIFQNIMIAPVEILGFQSLFTSLFSVSHNGGTWFISCILFCYLLFPFLQNCIKQIKFQSKIALIVFLGGILLYAPIVVRLFELSDIYSNPIFRMFEFLLGGLLAAMLPELEKHSIVSKVFLNRKAIFLELVFMIVMVSFIYQRGIARGDYMLYSWIVLPIFCMMIPALAVSQWPILGKYKMIEFLSELSYSFFLAQFFVWPLMRKIDVNSNLLRIISSILLCMGIAFMLHKLIETPCKKWLLNKLF